ncbi:MAG: aminoglycoside resistance protein [Verrucomicrobia bacterium]|nr:MAG: aminoglycoside resistance protein [Verrucomicrobiota bacterium]
MGRQIIDPGECAANIVDVHGEVGREWLGRLPATITECVGRWSLDILTPFKGLSYNYVTPATTADGRPVVIKAGVPSDELTSEIEALRLFDGKGMVRLLEADTDSGVMLLERLLPGTALSDLDDDDEVIRSAIWVLRRLCRSAPTGHGFRLLSDWASRSFAEAKDHFGGSDDPLSHDLIDTAQNLFSELIDPRNEQTLIHGDFHPQNVLRSERDSWLAIDPKGVVGDPLYDIAVLVCQPPRQPAELGPKQLLARRIDQVTEELVVDRQLITRWCLAHSVLSGCWAFGDHGDRWQPAFDRARLLKSLL